MAAKIRRVVDNATAQNAALPSGDVRNLNSTKDRAASSRTPPASVVDIDVEGSTVIQCSVCDKPANLDIKISDNYFCSADHEQDFS